MQVSPRKAERYGTQMGDRSDAYADNSSAEQPGLNYFFCLLVLFIVFLVLKSRGARPPEGGAAVMNGTPSSVVHIIRSIALASS